MEKYIDIKDVSQLIDAINNKDTSFKAEWDEIGSQRSGSVQKTLRYSILKKYWDNPEGEYKDVLQALINNDFEIRRINYKIYNAYQAEEKENSSEQYTDEMSFIMEDNGFFNYYYLHNKAYYKKHNPNVDLAETAIKKATNIYIENPKIWGPDIEGYLLYATYSLEMKDEFKKIIEQTETIPYSSNRVSDLMLDILNENDIKFFEDVFLHKPTYFKNLNKVKGISTPIQHVKDNENGLNIVNNLLDAAFEKMKFHDFNEDNQDNMFQFFMRNLDKIPLNLSGKVVTAKSDMSKDGVNLISWNSMDENVYISERAKYARKKVTVQKSSSLLYDIFLYEAENKNGFPLTNQYLDKSIETGQFLQVFNAIKRPKHLPSGYNAHDFYSDNHQLSNSSSNISAGDFLLYFQDFQDLIFHKMEDVFSNLNKQHKTLVDDITEEKNNPTNENKNIIEAKQKKREKLDSEISNLFQSFVKGSSYMNIGVRYNPIQADERIPGVKKPSYSLNDLVNKVKDNLNDISPTGKNNAPLSVSYFCNLQSEIEKKSQDEVINTVKFFVKNRENKLLSRDNIIFDHNILSIPSVAKPAIDTYLENIIEHPFKCIAGEYSVANSFKIISTYSSDNEYKNDKENKKKILESLSYLLDKTFKDGSIFKKPKASTFYNHQDTGDFFSSLILSTNIDSNLIFEALSKEQTKIIIEKYSPDLQKAILKSYNDKVTIIKTPSHKEGVSELNSILYKLTENGFKFDLDYKNVEHCTVISKALYSFNHPTAFNLVFEKNDIPLQQMLSTLIVGNDKSNALDILNVFQNDNLKKLINNNEKWSGLNNCFLNTDSEITYGAYLDQSKILTKENAGEFLLEAINNKQYASALCIVQRVPESILSTGKNKRTSLEIALKDIINFLNPKSKYSSTENAENAEKFIIYIAENSDVIIEDKKSRAGLFSAVTANHKTNISETMNIYYARQQHLLMGKEIDKISPNDVDENFNSDNHSSFKL